MKTAIYITRFFLLIVSALLSFSAKSQNIQRYNSFSYNVNEGLLQSNILDMGFDRNNFCWLSFANGIQKFDGKNFTLVPIQAGLPDDKWTSFFTCSDGNLFIAHSKGISRYDIITNRFKQIFMSPDPGLSKIIFIGEDEHILYAITPGYNIIAIDCHTLKVLGTTDTGLRPDYLNSVQMPYSSKNIVDHKTAMLFDKQFYLWDLKEKKMRYVSEKMPYISPYFLSLKSVDEVYFNTVSNDTSYLEAYSFSKQARSVITKRLSNDTRAHRSLLYKWQNKTLATVYNNLYETGHDLQELKYQMVNYQNKPIADNGIISTIKEDNFGNLYLITINSGFRKIIKENYTVKYYGSEKKEDNYVICILPDKKNNRILAGTYGAGLLIFDTLQHLIKHIESLPGLTTTFSVNTIVKNDNGEYIFFGWGSDNAWRLSNDLKRIDSIKISPASPGNKAVINYFANIISQEENESITQSQAGFYKINFSKNTIAEFRWTGKSPMGGMLYKNAIITHYNDELVFLDTLTFKEKKKIPFINTGNVRCFTKDAAGNIFVGCNKGIFKIDSTGKILLHLDKEKGLPDECIYAMALDADGLLWCSTNKGILKFDKNYHILQLRKEDGLQENEFNTNTVAMSEDGELFWGGVNGASSFFPSSINALEEKVNLLFTSIKINNEDVFKDTAVWNIKEINLAYDQNSLSFDFIAMANNNPDQYIYQYKMENVDEEWAQNNDLQTVHYYLPPGKYIFKIYASRVFDKDARSMKEILIWIHPPFWKTWWFITAIVLLFVLALAYSINRYNRNKYQRKVAALESEHKLQLERERISRDLHDNIGAYASTVLYKTELLQKESLHGERNELMNDLRFASKDIIASLRETIWALKKEEYDAQECLLRIRNFIQPFIKYYPNIRFSINGEAPASMILHYTKALNLVRIIQEAVSNSIKHAGASEINIESSIENNKWKLSVADNGTGFEYEGINELQQGNGLNNMKQRALDSGFDFSISSGHDKGTFITIFV